MGDHLILVGMMGAGKSTAARTVAARLGRPHLDTDVEVERALSGSVPEIFSARGEDGFREAESLALRAALATGPPAVVSVGGGAVLDPTNRVLLRRSGTVVWLRARPETLATRLGTGRDRPLLAADPDPLGALIRIEAQRRPLYEEVADEVVDVDESSPSEVARRILALVDVLVDADADAAADADADANADANVDAGADGGERR